MPVRTVQGKRPCKSPLKAPAPDSATAHKTLASQCENWFRDLPPNPNGHILSKQGALKAVMAAASHYAKELSRLKASQKSSKISQQLKDLALAAEKAADGIAKTNEHIQALNKLAEKLSADAIRRIGAVPSSILRILNEGENASAGLLNDRFDRAMARYGAAEISDNDRHVLQSEIFRSLLNMASSPFALLLDENQIPRLRSIEFVCRTAATLPGIANSTGGAKWSFQEFNLFPSHQLVEACMSILQASKLPQGNSKLGLLFDLAMAIRQSVEGPDADAVTRAIVDLQKRLTDRVSRLEGRVLYWVTGLLLEDLHNQPELDPGTTERLLELEIQKRQFNVMLSRKAVRRRVQSQKGTLVRIEFEPLAEIDESSPFR